MTATNNNPNGTHMNDTNAATTNAALIEDLTHCTFEFLLTRAGTAGNFSMSHGALVVVVASIVVGR